eukprot:UN00041
MVQYQPLQRSLQLNQFHHFYFSNLLQTPRFSICFCQSHPI